MEYPKQGECREFENGIFSGKQADPNRYVSSQKNNTQQRQYAPQGYKKAPAGRQCSDYCEGCSHNKKTDNTPVILAVVMSVFALTVVFMTAILVLICLFMWRGRESVPPVSAYAPVYDAAPEAEEKNAVPDDSDNNKPPQKSKAETAKKGDYYGEIKDALTEGLSYSVDFENYEFEGNSDTINISVDYPVVKGEVPNRDVLNDIISQEILYFEEYYKEYSKYMLEGEIFDVYAEGYITYMDEDVMSIVFKENISTDYWQDSGLFCINIDMENGVVVDNNSILDMDSEFAVDFRVRSREQNGSENAVDFMTDQEIIYYLSNASTTIIFYTPLGMEVGINYGEGYATVTYKDYIDFTKKI